MRKSGLFVMLLLICSCQPSVPELLIPEDKLVGVLVDTHVAEAAIQNLPSDLKDSLGEVYYRQIFEIHDVNEEDFEQTMSILREDPIRLEIIYEQVMDQLSSRQAETR